MTMNKLQAMATFVRIVETRSFTRAAESLGVPRSSVTTTLKQLEAHLGTPLLRRSTRSLNLTEPGALYYERCRSILADIAATEGEIASSAAAPKGRVRVDMPGALARAVLVPRLTEFERQYPDIELILGLSDRPADLIYDGIDCAIRSGEPSDSALVARRIGLLQWITCASPLYLKTHGEPRSVQDLSAHLAVNYLSGTTGRPLDWRFNVDGEAVCVPMASRFSVNETEAYIHCALEGLGMVQLSELIVKPYLATGRLKEVLAHQRTKPMPVSIVYPYSRQTSAAVQCFVGWVADIFGDSGGTAQAASPRSRNTGSRQQPGDQSSSSGASTSSDAFSARIRRSTK
jgi:LysR family transcriptional regulator for bpeEF and oprC